MSPSEHDLEKPFSEEGYALMGAAFDVHREIGGGLLEEIYQESLEIELQDRGTPFRAKEEIAVFYKGRKRRCQTPNATGKTSVIQGVFGASIDLSQKIMDSACLPTAGNPENRPH